MKIEDALVTSLLRVLSSCLVCLSPSSSFFVGWLVSERRTIKSNNASLQFTLSNLATSSDFFLQPFHPSYCAQHSIPETRNVHIYTATLNRRLIFTFGCFEFRWLEFTILKIQEKWVLRENENIIMHCWDWDTEVVEARPPLLSSWERFSEIWRHMFQKNILSLHLHFIYIFTSLQHQKIEVHDFTEKQYQCILT